IRTRPDRGFCEVIERARVAERLALPGFEDDAERLLESRLALGVRDSEHVVGARRAAAADAEVEAALAQMIDGRDVFGDPEGIAERQHLHRRADAHAPGAGGDEARQRDRRRVHGAGRIEVNLAEPYAVESRRLGRLCEVERFLERGVLARPGPPFLQKNSELHGRYPQSRRLAMSAPSLSARSLAHTTLGAHISEPANVPKPQSVDAITRVRSPIAATAWPIRSATTSGCST